MNQINFNNLINLKKKKAKCSKVIAFQPTGWTHNTNNNKYHNDNNNSNNSSKSDILHRREKDGNVIYSVPYSEHSSFTELIDFVNTFRYISILMY